LRGVGKRIAIGKSPPATHEAVILRSRALARRLEGSAAGARVHPSRLAVKNGEHLRMTAV
jgi:hypothetical protein